MKAKIYSKYKNDLIQLREEIISEIEKNRKMHASDTITDLVDDIDLASEYQTRQFDLLLNERDRQKLDQIQIALDKIDSGDYGLCEECGDEISEQRLNALPFSTLCIECKRKLESEQTNIRANPNLALDSSSSSEEAEE